MTRIFDDPAVFEADALDGLAAAPPAYVSRVDGGVVRSTVVPRGQVALVVGGGSGHYPAFAGLVGPGIATGSACGNLFASPAVGQIYRVAKACDHGGGVLFSFGNYAGDVLNFGQAQQRLREEGIDARTVLVTDDIASAPPDEFAKRRGIAGDLAVYKIAGAAAESGLPLDEVERLARKANERTRSLGVAFGGCTVPGAPEPLFTVPAGQMSVGLGIHGEPGIAEVPIPTASELAELLVGRLLAERPAAAGTRLAVLLNGLGTVKYEELYGLYGKIAALLTHEGLQVVEPEVGEFVTSLDMSGASLTLCWLDEELEALWRAPADTPAYRKGAAARPERATVPAGVSTGVPTGVVSTGEHEEATAASRAVAATVADLFGGVEQTIREHVEELGRIDAVAGDGDHGTGMLRGASAASASARASARAHLGVHELLVTAAEQWSEKAGGTSGALWAAAITAIAHRLGDRHRYAAVDAGEAARAGLDAITAAGGARPGDKTMVDAMAPYVERLNAELAEGASLGRALAEAARSAREAAEATATLRPRLGRARPLADKSVGHPDAGATSFGLIAARLADAVGALEAAQATD
ncbi:MAG TPA: dihydroxyacetone kinase family protein [Amycolatopsis sp.]|nr:dihydroxyacetone kinase family protein [Amycolatopsis sp.]